MLAKYAPSGRCSVLMIPAAIALIALALGLGWAYQWGLDHFGARRLPFVVVAGATAMLWFSAYGATFMARCRAPLYAMIVGLLAALAMIASSHSVKHQQAVSAGAPPGISDNFRWRAAQGVGARPAAGSRPARAPKYTGGMLIAMWWGEGALLVAAGALGAAAATIKPFCETCSRHAAAAHWTLRLDRPPPHEIEAVAKATDVAQFMRQPWTEEGPENSALVYSLNVCPSCGGVPTLTVSHEKNEGGATWWLSWVLGWVAWLWKSESSTNLHAGILLTEEQVGILTEWAAALPGFKAEALEEAEQSAPGATQAP